MSETEIAAADALRGLLVTGGSRGIGAATALLCARQGWAVAVNYTRDAAAAEGVVQRIRADGGQALALQADVADEAQVLAMFARLDAEWPPLGGLGGAIVNLSSAAARLGAPGQYVDYAAAKGAIDTFTLGLAREVAAEGVRVNAVRPGIIDTDIHASGGQPDRARQMAPQVPMQRPGSADEVAQAIAWLLSPAAGYTTGAVVDVTGGR